MSEGFYKGPGGIHHHDQTKQAAIESLRDARGFFVVVTSHDSGGEITGRLFVSGENMVLSGAATIIASEQAPIFLEKMRESVEEAMEAEDC